jgi:exonuclease SbcC
MRLNSLHLCNFRQHLDTRIEFDTGITGIIGPNGSGKSTILEAIAWALYGTPAARGTRESIRAHRAPPRAAVRVDLDFELGGHRYLVSRGLTTAELYLDGATAPIASSITGVTELLHRRLGMSHQEFFNTYFTGQKELSVMATMGPTDRAQFLSRVLGYERLREAQRLVRERRRSITDEIAGLQRGMPDPDAVQRQLDEAEARLKAARRSARDVEARRTSTRRTLDEVTPRWEAMQRERDARQALIAELRVAESEEAAASRELARLDRELTETDKAREELQTFTAELTPFAALEAELKELDRACNEESRRKTLLESERLLVEELSRLGERRLRLDSAPAREQEVADDVFNARADLEKAQADFESARTEWVQDKQEADTKRQALLEQLKEVEQQREQIVELGENGICPTCARPLGTHFRSVLEFLDTQRETILVNGKYFKARIAQLKEMPAAVKALDERRRQVFETVAKLEARLAKIQQESQELETVTRDIAAKEQRLGQIRSELATIRIEYDAPRHAEVRREVERLTPIAARATRLSAQLEREPQLRTDYARAFEQLKGHGARIVDLTVKRDAMQFSEESFAHMRATYERAAAELRAAELAMVSAEAELAGAQSAVETADQAKAELVRIETQLQALIADRRLHDELDRAFNDLRTDLNLQLRPELSELASRYLRELTDGRYTELELDDQYNILVLEDAIPKPVISGGEEDLANLVLRLAISEMIAERAGQSFSLLILDEIFGSLDESRRHNVVDLLHRLQDRFEQVILITHIESVREGLDHVVSVRYDEETGSSRVAMEPLAGSLELDVQAGAAD